MPFLFSKNRKQLKYIFDWLNKTVQQNDLILLEQKGKLSAYYFEFPLKIGQAPKKLKHLQDKKFTFFIRISSVNQALPVGQWQIIFQSPGIEIHENKERFHFLGIKPLRWGLTEEEKILALKIARRSLEIFLKERRIPQAEDIKLAHSPPFLTLRTDLDITLWGKGLLRGSAVIKDRNLMDALIEGAVLASRDARFKPLKLKELAQARIEIILISDLKVPLGRDLIRKNEIFHDKGYLLKREEKEGWFLPAVFNTGPFGNLKEFLLRLGSEKALLPQEKIFDKKTDISIFQVEDFIESNNQIQIEVLALDGPIIKFQQQKKQLEKMSLRAADWLMKIQDSDGNFPPIINPLTGQKSQIDWPRSALTAWSLVELGKTINQPAYIEAGQKNFFYLKEYLLEEPSFIDNLNPLAVSLVCFGQLGLSLGYWSEAFEAGSRILEKENQMSFEPIVFQQIGSFITELSKKDQNFFEPALRLAQTTKDAFEKNLTTRQPVNLALWAELVNLFLKLFEISDDSSYLATAQKTINWLLSGQLDSGAFKSTTHSDFVYTRGTAKIAEVLATIFLLRNREIDSAFNLNYCKKCLEKTFDWLGQMQYTAENSYFVPSKNLKKVMGGIRHDYFNPDLWIDSVGHLFLAVSRFLKNN